MARVIRVTVDILDDAVVPEAEAMHLVGQSVKRLLQGVDLNDAMNVTDFAIARVEVIPPRRVASIVPLVVTSMLALMVLAGCNQRSPVAPTQTTQPPVAAPVAPPPGIILAGGTPYTGPTLAHNVPATMPDGTPVWMCETKPRQYALPNGETEWTLDHYIIFGNSGCPEIPID